MVPFLSSTSFVAASSALVAWRKNYQGQWQNGIYCKASSYSSWGQIHENSFNIISVNCVGSRLALKKMRWPDSSSEGKTGKNSDQFRRVPTHPICWPEFQTTDSHPSCFFPPKYRYKTRQTNVRRKTPAKKSRALTVALPKEYAISFVSFSYLSRKL